MTISSFLCPTTIFMGEGSFKKISEIVRKFKCKRLFVALDGALVASDFFAQIRKLLADEEVEIAMFTEIEPDPSAHTVEKAFAVCQAHKATVLLAIGGGSTIDVAKAVGILATNGGRIHDYEGIEKFAVPPLPLIAIPTTAGTGSEVSGSCVISDTEKNLRCRFDMRHLIRQRLPFWILSPCEPCLVMLPRTLALMHSCMRLSRMFRDSRIS